VYFVDTFVEEMFLSGEFLGSYIKIWQDELNSHMVIPLSQKCRAVKICHKDSERWCSSTRPDFILSFYERTRAEAAEQVHHYEHSELQ
jgi:hypothetical protein